MEGTYNPDSHEIKQKNHEYFYYEFSYVKSKFSNITETYLNTIKNIEDPILQHISLYLVHNYNNYKPDFSDTGDYSKNEACKNLNRWIDKEKSIYTRATKCSKNKDAWNKHIESLWEKLQINNNNGKKCNRYEHFSNTTTFPDELKEYTCYQHVPENYTCTAPQVNSSTTENPCSNCITTCPPCKNNCTNSESTIQSSYLTSTPDNCATICTQMCPDGFPSLIPTVSISVCFTLLGVFILQFFLYKFTPLVSKLYRRQMKKNRVRSHMSEAENYEAYLRHVDRTNGMMPNRANLRYQYAPN